MDHKLLIFTLMIKTRQHKYIPNQCSSRIQVDHKSPKLSRLYFAIDDYRTCVTSKSENLENLITFQIHFIHFTADQNSPFLMLVRTQR